jgi:hypothetical protein
LVLPGGDDHLRHFLRAFGQPPQTIRRAARFGAET